MATTFLRLPELEASCWGGEWGTKKEDAVAGVLSAFAPRSADGKLMRFDHFAHSAGPGSKRASQVISPYSLKGLARGSP